LSRPLRKGDIVLVPFPFADLTAVKVRPAVVLTPEPTGSDLVVAYVSSVIPDQPVPASCVVISSDHPEFRVSGLKQPSAIRLDKLMTIARPRIRRRLGHLGPFLLAELDSRFRAAFGL
jgi:mRNA interferase MazF